MEEWSRQDIYTGSNSYNAPPSGLIRGDNVQKVDVASESSGYNFPKPEHGLHHQIMHLYVIIQANRCENVNIKLPFQCSGKNRFFFN